MKKIKLIQLLILGTLPTLSIAQLNEIYRYKDTNGNLIYTDKLPTNKKVEVSILSKKSGVLKNLSDLEESKAAQEMTESEKEEMNKAKNKEEEQLKKDQQLLNTYSSPKDIDDIKKYELEQIDRAMQNDINIIAALKERKLQLEKDIKQNPKLRSDYDSELRRISENLDKTNLNLSRNKEMYAQRDKKYSDEKERLIAVMKSISKDKKE